MGKLLDGALDAISESSIPLTLAPFFESIVYATAVDFEGIPHEVLPKKSFPDIFGADWTNDFRLPHKVTAVEDIGSCVILIDPAEDTKGLLVRRAYIEIRPTDCNSNREAFAAGNFSTRPSTVDPEDLFFTIGFCEGLQYTSRDDHEERTGLIVVATAISYQQKTGFEELSVNRNPALHRDLRTDAGNSVFTAIEELEYLRSQGKL